MAWDAIELVFSPDGKESLTEINPKLRYVVRYLTRPVRSERIESAYWGFDDDMQPSAFVNWYRRNYPGCKLEVRRSAGRTDAVWEVKVSRHDRLAESITAWLAKQEQARQGGLEFGRSRPPAFRGVAIG
jgi:hypothetical protein